MNKKMEWYELLAGTQNFDEGEFNNIVVANCSSQKGLMIYRNELLKKMNTPDFNKGITIDNMQQWFLEPITKQEVDMLKNNIQYNYWTIEDLWNVCKNESIGVFTASSQINTNVKFYKGMKIYNFKGQVVNTLENEAHIMEINYIKDDEKFDLMEFLLDIKKYTIPIALVEQVVRIRDEHIKNATDFTLSKENVQYLSAEICTDTVYSILKKIMRRNKWTLEELAKESLKTDINMFMVSGCPNKKGVSA